MQLIVADGMSQDGTRQLLQRYQVQYAQLTVIDNPGRIVPKALNAAISLARGKILIRVDGHCQIAPDYVSRCVQHLLVDEVDGVGGPTETVGETRLARWIALAMSSPFGVGGSAFRTKKDETCLADTIPFPAYTREIVQRAGPYDEELVRNQDDEYNYRLRALGAKLLLAADVRSVYYSRSSLASLWRQYFQYGFWKVRVLQKHPRQMSLRQFAPPAFVAALLGSALLALVVPLGRWLLALVLGLYLVANLGASLWTAAKRDSSAVWLLPLIYAILHLSYGSGFLLGLLRFAGRWRSKT
jgi:glycosyltransferase involved in cell wall biosynthesis